MRWLTLLKSGSELCSTHGKRKMESIGVKSRRFLTIFLLIQWSLTIMNDFGRILKKDISSKVVCQTSPNQTDIEAQYIKDNYKQVTLPFALNYVSTVTRAFADLLWNWILEDDDVSRRPQKHSAVCEKEIKNYGSVENLFNSSSFFEAADAMGWLLWSLMWFIPMLTIQEPNHWWNG